MSHRINAKPSNGRSSSYAPEPIGQLTPRIALIVRCESLSQDDFNVPVDRQVWKQQLNTMMMVRYDRLAFNANPMFHVCVGYRIGLQVFDIAGERWRSSVQTGYMECTRLLLFFVANNMNSHIYESTPWNLRQIRNGRRGCIKLIHVS